MSSKALAVAALVLSGCLPDAIDSGVDAGPVARPSPLATSDAGSCAPRATSIEDGHHDPGTACLDCHNGSKPDARRFTVAGTLFLTNNDPNQPLSAATVEVVDLRGNKLTLTTQKNGNFYTDQPIADPPWQVHISQSPTATSMPTPTMSGDCNSCHAQQSQVYLTLPMMPMPMQR
jgi:hypothetical protein